LLPKNDVIYEFIAQKLGEMVENEVTAYLQNYLTIEELQLSNVEKNLNVENGPLHIKNHLSSN
jgi:hypothetical protein